MKIEEIEYTPNPNAMKFVLDQQLTLGGRTRSFEDLESTDGVPLAQAIMQIDHVISLFFADRWLSVTQDGGADWHQLMREIADPIRAASLDDARPVGEAGDAPATGNVLSDEEAGLNDPRMEAIRLVIDEQIMPYLQGDGGGLQIRALIDDQLMIRYEGACGTCPSAIAGTLKGIENLVRSQVDPGLAVVAV
jgi:Fe-S cluster biogenesis protein NfuA